MTMTASPAARAARKLARMALNTSISSPTISVLIEPELMSTS
jgi:hypothetical protein